MTGELANLAPTLSAGGVATTLIVININQIYRLLRQRDALDVYREASRNGWSTSEIAAIIAATGDGRKRR